MFKQLLEFQARNEKTMIYEFKNIHTKIDGNYSDLNNKYMQLVSHLKALESQVDSMPSSSKQPMGSLPGKPEKNPKKSCNVVFSTTSSEIELSDHEKEEDEIERLVFGTEFGEVERFVVATAEAQIVKDAARKARNEKTMIYEFKNIHANGNYYDINNKYMQLASHLKALESKVASRPSSSKQPMGSLPAKPEKNPKESCNVIFSTASPDIELSNHEKDEDEIERLVFGTEFGEVERFVVVTAEAQIVKDAARKFEATNLQRAELKAEKQRHKSMDRPREARV
ncbi:hypothetical protein F2Q69_00019847 [Brassica cretica]|uniref:Uncharacterized protein n=1 Tax=Brassica cretica TaxID=69181 RepID=A0A8S9QFD7_BRACR|nr:hypothetical protein F2Q69_00019847 [Brassica cretica]